MTQEEKAKAYDKAIAKSVEFLSLCKKCGAKDTVDFLESIFPELKGSEDEKIRKAILEHIQLCTESIPDRDKFITWLEKQGEQKSSVVDFKAKDWYVSKVDGKIHNATFMEKTPTNQASEKQGEPYGQRKECFNCQFNYAGECKGSCAMKRSEQESTWSEWDDIMICELIHYLNYRNEQGDFHAELIRDWVVSLKDRTQSVKMKEISEYEKGKADAFAEMEKPTWSVEDMSKVQRICKYLNEAKKYYADITEVRDCIDWLKSLKDRVQPQSQWKPSEEQIMALRWVLNHIPYDSHKEEISGLLEQLKKLTE